MPDIGLHAKITADISQFQSAMKQAQGSYQGFLLGLVSRVHPLLGAVTALGSQLRSVQERADGLVQRAGAVAERVGGDVQVSFEQFQLSLDELRAGISAAFDAQRARGSGLISLFDTLIERATELSRRMTGTFEAWLPAGERSTTALNAQIEELQRRIERLGRLRTDAYGRNSDLILNLFGYRNQTELAAAIDVSIRELLRLQGVLENREQPFGHLQVSEIDQQIEAMEKQT